jgi:tRNA (guanine37-N1)-methyltransferase
MYKTFDIVGSTAIIRVPETLTNQSRLIAEAIMKTHREVKSVWRQTSSISGDYRLRKLEHVFGEKKTETLYKEHGCVYERLRIAELIKKGETVLNMFAGVGCYSIAIANHAKPMKVISVDVNPIAFNYLQENIRLNRAEKIVVPILGDAKNIIEDRFQNSFDRVLMPLPERAYEYLDYALFALKPDRGWIHYYDFEHANKNEDPVDKAKKRVSEKLSGSRREFQVKFERIVRTIGPRWFQVVLDIKVQK